MKVFEAGDTVYRVMTEKFTVGQKVWLRPWVGDNAEYKEGTVASVSTTGAKVRVSWADGTDESYTKSTQSLLLSADDVVFWRKRDQLDRVRSRLRDALVQLGSYVMGDGTLDDAHLQRSAEVATHIKALVASLSSPKNGDVGQ